MEIAVFIGAILAAALIYGLFKGLAAPGRQNPSAPPKPVICRHCQSAMHKTKKVRRDLTLQFAGVILLILSIVLLFFFPIGTLTAIPLMIVSGRLGYSKDKVWLCENCQYFFKI